MGKTMKKDLYKAEAAFYLYLAELEDERFYSEKHKQMLAEHRKQLADFYYGNGDIDVINAEVKEGWYARTDWARRNYL